MRQTKRRPEAIIAEWIKPKTLSKIESSFGGVPLSSAHAGQSYPAAISFLIEQAKQISEQHLGTQKIDEFRSKRREFQNYFKKAKHYLSVLSKLDFECLPVDHQKNIVKYNSGTNDMHDYGISFREFCTGSKDAIADTIARLAQFEDLLEARSAGRGAESIALEFAGSLVCFFALSLKGVCTLSNEEYHDVATALWVAAGLPDKGNGKKGNTLRAFIVKHLKSQEQRWKTVGESFPPSDSL